MKTIGSDEFHIRHWELDTMSNISIKIYPINLYWERNYDKNDTRVQFGIGLFNYRIGICFDYIG